MKVELTVVGIALVGVVSAFSAMGARAKPEYSGVVVKTHKLSATAAKALSCATCHVSSSNFARNPYGKQQEKEMGNKKDLTMAILEKIAKLDADNDGTSNEDELKAGTNPGNPKSGAAKKKPADDKTAPTEEKPADDKTAPADGQAPVEDKKSPS